LAWSCILPSGRENAAETCAWSSAGAFHDLVTVAFTISSSSRRILVPVKMKVRTVCAVVILAGVGRRHAPWPARDKK